MRRAVRLSVGGTPSPYFLHEYQNKGLRSNDRAMNIILKDLGPPQFFAADALKKNLVRNR